MASMTGSTAAGGFFTGGTLTLSSSSNFIIWFNFNLLFHSQVKGFSHLLHSEWIKRHPQRNDTARALNMMYTRVLKEGVSNPHYYQLHKEENFERRWTPKHNKALRKMAEASGRGDLSALKYQDVIEDFRAAFPNFQEDFLRKRISDLVTNALKSPRRNSADEKASSSLASSKFVNLETLDSFLIFVVVPLIFLPVP